MNLFKGIFNRDPVVDASRIEDEAMASWSAIDHLTPQMLANAINAFTGGDIAPLALLWKEARRRDDLIPGVEGKRLASVARKDWEIVALEKGKLADRQKEAVEYFFDNLIHRDVMDADKIGGVSSLMRTMLTSIGYGWTAHEMVWKPSVRGLTAEMRAVPIWFFERKKGRLRYLQSAYAIEGIDMEEGAWFVTASDSILAIACLILYLFKNAPKKDWAVYCKRYVIPGLHGKTPSKKGSPGWNSLKTALANFKNHFSLVTGTDVEIKAIDAAAKGDLPFDGLIDGCNRRLTALWRGADLSTMSTKEGTGASVQDKETETITADDAAMVEEVISMKLIPLILKYTFGEGVEQLVKFRLPSSSSDQKTDLEVDKFFVENGIPQGEGDLYERYGRSRPEEGEEAVGAKPKEPAPVKEPVKKKEELPHTQMIHATLEHTIDPIMEAIDRDLAPLRDRIEKALQLPDAEMIQALHTLAEDSPAIYRLIDDLGHTPEAMVHALVDAMEDGFKNTGDTDA